MLPLPKTLQWLQLLSKCQKKRGTYKEAKSRILWAIDTVNPFVSHATCFPRALTAKTLLAQAGFESTLRIGITKSLEGKLEAHAWLERDGQVIIGDLEDLQRYTLLPTESIKTL